MGTGAPLFISYSRRDTLFVLRFSEDLKSAGINIWVDQFEIPAGRPWDREIEEALSKARKVIAVLSPSSVASDHVLNEIEFAVSAGKVIIPILLADCQIPFHIRRLQQIDFRDDYESAMKRLIADLEDAQEGIQSDTFSSQERQRISIELIASLVGHSDTIRSVAFSPAGNLLITASHDKTARIWRAQRAQCIHTLTGHTKWVSGAEFSPNGRYVLTSSYDGSDIIWEVSSGLIVTRVDGRHTVGYGCSAFSRTGEQIVTSGDDGVSRVWDAVTGRLVSQNSNGKPYRRDSGSIFSPDSRHVLTLTPCEPMRMWRVLDGKTILDFDGYKGALSVGFSPHGHWIITGGEDKTARLWDTVTGVNARIFQGHSRPVISAAFSFDGKRIVTVPSRGESTVRLWDALSGNLIAPLNGHTGNIWCAKFSRAGSRLLTATDESIFIWNAMNGQLLAKITSHRQVGVCAAWAVDGDQFATGSEESGRLYRVHKLPVPAEMV